MARESSFCFERRHRYDVVLRFEKITGSVQRRMRDAILQHGSIILGCQFDQQRVGRVSVSYDTTVVRLPSLFVEELGTYGDLQFEDGGRTPEKFDAAGELVQKNAGDECTKRIQEKEYSLHVFRNSSLGRQSSLWSERSMAPRSRGNFGDVSTQ